MQSGDVVGASYFEIIYGLNLLGRSSLALADNFCYVKIGRFLSWLKDVANENLKG